MKIYLLMESIVADLQTGFYYTPIGAYSTKEKAQNMITELGGNDIVYSYGRTQVEKYYIKEIYLE